MSKTGFVEGETHELMTRQRWMGLAYLDHGMLVVRSPKRPRAPLLLPVRVKLRAPHDCRRRPVEGEDHLRGAFQPDK